MIRRFARLLLAAAVLACSALAMATLPAHAALPAAHAGEPMRAGPATPTSVPTPASDVPSTAAPRIGVMTIAPGDIFWERFGHDAIVVEDPATGRAISYNYGYFDPTEADFTARFVAGRMRYMLAALPLEEDLANYRAEGRGVSIQWLDLTPAEARRLADWLAVQARPENAHYHYDYFTRNCATKVRDAIDMTLDGQLHHLIAGRSRGNTYRSEAVRLASPVWWMWLGFDLGLSGRADQQLSRWGEAFVPMRLADSLDQVQLADGRRLVSRTEQVLPQRLAPEPRDTPRPWWPWALWGVGIALLLRWLGQRRPRLLVALAVPFWLLAGIGGLVLAYLWLFTQHWAAWGNQNLLLLNPLCLLLLPGGVLILFKRDPGRLFRAAAWLVVAAAGVALLLKWVQLFSQDNLRWVMLLLPIHFALAWTLARRH